jgi:N-acetylmuramoyl-L-alanine amidase
MPYIFLVGWSDIGFNYLIGNDGQIYEGRGSDYVGATAKDWNSESLGFAFIGKYVDKLPSGDALDVMKSFLRHLVQQSVLTTNFTIYCLRQVSLNTGATIVG